LPKQLEPRHIFVNLATTEFKLQDMGREVFNFKTVNGGVFHRTPTMKDQITYVNINPTWTVPANLAIKETIPKVLNDSEYLQKNDMALYSASNNQPVDVSSVDWDSVTPTHFPYFL